SDLADVLRRRVDLVSDARRELSDGLELLRDSELRLDLLTLGDLRAQRVIDARELVGALAHPILELVVVPLYHLKIAPHTNRHRGAEHEQQHADSEQHA